MSTVIHVFQCIGVHVSQSICVHVCECICLDGSQCMYRGLRDAKDNRETCRHQMEMAKVPNDPSIYLSIDLHNLHTYLPACITYTSIYFLPSLTTYLSTYLYINTHVCIRFCSVCRAHGMRRSNGKRPCAPACSYWYVRARPLARSYPCVLPATMDASSPVCTSYIVHSCICCG
jgi:hypothetical protein